MKNMGIKKTISGVIILFIMISIFHFPVKADDVFYNLNLNANGGISGSKTGNPRLSIEASSVTATAADSRGAIYNFRGGISLVDCIITAPTNGKFNEATGNIVNSEGSVADNVVIQSTASALETVPVDSQSQAQKILKDGNLYICLPNGKIYNAIGCEIK